MKEINENILNLIHDIGKIKHISTNIKTISSNIDYLEKQYLKSLKKRLLIQGSFEQIIVISGYYSKVLLDELKTILESGNKIDKVIIIFGPSRKYLLKIEQENGWLGTTRLFTIFSCDDIHTLCRRTLHQMASSESEGTT